MAKLSRDAKIMMGTLIPAATISITAIALVVANPFKTDNLFSTNGNIFNKSRINISNFKPSLINEDNINTFFGYEINENQIEESNYQLIFSEADDAKGTIKISLQASKAYVNSEIQENVVIDEQVFEGFHKNPNTNVDIKIKEGINITTLVPSFIKDSNVNDFFDYDLNGDVVLDSDYVLSPSEQNDSLGTIKISLLATKAYVDGEVQENVEIGAKKFDNLRIETYYFWNEEGNFEVKSKGTNGTLIKKNISNFPNSDTSFPSVHKNKIVNIPDTIKSNFAGEEEINIKIIKPRLFYVQGPDNPLNWFVSDLSIGKNIEIIGDNAFYGNKIKEIQFPESLKSIGNGAFFSNRLTSLTIPNSVTTIGEGAFNNNKLTSLTIPNSVTEIGDNAFANNCFDLLSGIVLPKKFNTHEERERIFGVDPLLPINNAIKNNPIKVSLNNDREYTKIKSQDKKINN